jgi:peroxiredoxin
VASRVGIKLPSVTLAASDNTKINLATVKGRLVIFCYPFTGRTNYPNPPKWDEIPGAHGSSPQALAFSSLYHEFETLQVKVFGLSFLSPEWQTDFATRHNLPFLLLSDEAQIFSRSLKLDTFQTGGQDYLSRISFIIENGVIIHEVFPILHPERNAEDVLAILKK